MRLSLKYKAKRSLKSHVVQAPYNAENLELPTPPTHPVSPALCPEDGGKAPRFLGQSVQKNNSFLIPNPSHIRKSHEI